MVHIIYTFCSYAVLISVVKQFIPQYLSMCLSQLQQPVLLLINGLKGCIRISRYLALVIVDQAGLLTLDYSVLFSISGHCRSDLLGHCRPQGSHRSQALVIVDQACQISQVIVDLTLFIGHCRPHQLVIVDSYRFIVEPITKNALPGCPIFAQIPVCFYCLIPSPVGQLRGQLMEVKLA